MLPTLLDSIQLPTPTGYRLRPDEVTGDKAYTGLPVRQYLRRRGIKALIPEKALPAGHRRRKKGPHYRFSKETYKERNVIERLFNHLKECRRFATRFEKLADTFLAMITLAFIRFLLRKHFSDTP